MKFETYIPCDTLKPFIRSLVISEASDEAVYKVLPDTGLVIGFQYKGKLSHVCGDAEISLSVSGITGLGDAYKIFKNSADIGTVLIYFKEAGASRFFRHPMHELFGQSISLDNFMLRSELTVLEEQLREARTDLARIMTCAQEDTLVMAALTTIYTYQGNIRIKHLCEQLNISQSSLEKRFRQVVGASPKKFSSIVRIKVALRNYVPNSHLTTLGYQSGFYDQAHFIKEFKAFTGETPQKYFQEK